MLAIIVAVIIALADSDEENAAERAPTPPDKGLSARLAVRHPPENAVFTVGAEELPRPPGYTPDPAGQQESHCDQWEEWLKAQRAAMLSNVTLTVSAPAEAAATITAIRVEVHRSDEPDTTSLVLCRQGAGAFDPTYVRVDLEKPATRPVLFQEDRGGEVGPIPESVFTVAAGRTENLAFQVTGAQQTFYEWSFEVDVVVDKTEKTVAFGSTSQPFRTWIGDPPTSIVEFDLSSGTWAPTG